MASNEQFKFAFPEEPEKKEPPAASKLTETAGKRESSGPSHIELDDECQSCGAPFESERSCRYCAGNPTKRAYLKTLKK